MQKLLFSLLIMGWCTMAATAQKVAAPEKSDPEAKKILDKVRKKYEGYKTLEATFALIIELPNQPKEVQKGTISQEGTKFRLDMDEQIIATDGKSTWVYLKKNKEIQVSDAEPNDGSDNGFMTPTDLLKRYEKGDFLYALIDKVTENSVVLTQIEFKPKDKKSEYSKMRISIDEKNNSIKSIKAFAKDSGRYTFTINTLKTNKPIAASQFSIDAKKYPGVKVVDLRM
jgi:outer membrane lipoprotein carrier protein